MYNIMTDMASHLYFSYLQKFQAISAAYTKLVSTEDSDAEDLPTVS